MSDLAAWLARLEARQPTGARLSLERISRVIGTLGLHLAGPLITVAGTNGKGSTCAFLEAILTAAGHRPLCNSSPHLLDFRERVRIAGTPASAATLVRCFATVEAADAERPPGTDPVTYFEAVTLAAAVAGNAASCRAFVFEVGLGGRLDAVNAFDADVAIITSVALDHVAVLGPDREAIGVEKAGIARPGRPLIIGDRQPPASVLAAAAAVGAPAHVRGRDFRAVTAGPSWNFHGQGLRAALPPPALRGPHQLANAACALAALECLADRLPVSQAEVRAGLLATSLPGRFEVLPGPVPVVLDVAHNAAAAQALAGNLLDMGPFPATHFIIGIRARKDAAAIIAALAGRAAAWHVVPLAGEDPLPVITAAQATGVPVHAHADMAAAATAALAPAAGADRVVVCGSFLTVEAFMRARAAGVLESPVPEKRS